MYAFDADVLIYAAEPGHRLGQRVLALFPDTDLEDTDAVVGVGSMLLLPELLPRPARHAHQEELDVLGELLGRLDLRPVDETIASYAVGLGISYRLKPIDAVHLATAVAVGADHFLTNNRRDFKREIAEVEIVYPEDLPKP